MQVFKKTLEYQMAKKGRENNPRGQKNRAVQPDGRFAENHFEAL